MLIGIPIPDQNLRVASEYMLIPPKKRGFVSPRATASAPSIAEDHGHGLPRVGVVLSEIRNSVCLSREGFVRVRDERMSS